MKKSEHIEKPEELDFTSPSFNPLRALYEPGENVTIPRPNAPIYDNVSCFIETKDGIFPKERKLPTMKQSQSSTSTNVEEKQEVEETARRKRRVYKNVLTRMDNTVTGPLAFLKKCMDEKLRIKVYTRGPVNIRGFCVGFLEAFDKHWNLVLKDVFEEWTRRRRKRSVCMDDERREKCSQNLEERSNFERNRDDDRVDDGRKPKTVVRKRLKRKEICERHVDQLLIRGEQIVLLSATLWRFLNSVQVPKKTECQFEMNNELKVLFVKAIGAVQPGLLIKSTLRRQSNTLIVRDRFLALDRNCYLVGFGKAVQEMAMYVEELVGDHLREGILSIPVGSSKCTFSPTVSVLEGAKNNLPDADSFNAACQIKELVQRCSNKDLLLVLISGGGSALLPYPTVPVSLSEKTAVIKAVTAAGADIGELNSIRKALSQLKGGKLALLAHPATVISFILSDVVGDPLNTIASGPTVLPYVSTLPEALSILQKYQIFERVPESVRQVLQSTDAFVDKAKSVRPDVHNIIIGNNSTCLMAMKENVDQFNNHSVILTHRVVGFVTEVTELYSKLIECICLYLHKGDQKNLLCTLDELKIYYSDVHYIDDIVKQLYDYIEQESNIDLNCQSLFLISGGEPTVNIKGCGKGGRNQELSLRMAVALNRLKVSRQWMSKFDVYFLSGGTDGIDGPTDAAGAIVNTDSIDEALSENLRAEIFLENNDSYTFFSQFNGGSHLTSPAFSTPYSRF